MNDARSAMLQALDQAVLNSPQPAPGPSEPSARDDTPEHLWEQLASELAAVSTIVHRAATPQQAETAILDILSAHAVTLATRWEHPLLEQLGLDDILARAGVRLAAPQPGQTLCQALEPAQLGVTAVDAALAQSGTLVVRAAPGRPRSASLVPPVHLAIVARETLLPDVTHLPGRMRQWARDGLPPSAVHGITGPSSTSDIEMIRVEGVHGPTTLHALLLDWE